MARRYSFLDNKDRRYFQNYACQVLMCARDGNEGMEVLCDLLTDDEQMKIGRRVAILEQLHNGLTYREISINLNVGIETVQKVSNQFFKGGKGYKRILSRLKSEQEWQKSAGISTSGGTLKFRKQKRNVNISNMLPRNKK